MSKAKNQSKPSWRQLLISVAEEASPLVQEILLSEGAIGLEIDDDETRAIPEKPFTPTHRAQIIATFEHSKNIEKRIGDRLASFSTVFSIEWRDLADGDWANEFLRSWKSFTLGDDIWMVPSWEQKKFKAPHKNSLVLYIDPGMAFGTGHHETTTLCARAIRHHIMNAEQPEQMRVLDVGTGTGILAMIAAKLGAKRVVGTDNDPQACDVAIENCQKNDAGNIEILDAAPDFDGPIFDLVVANILARPLIEMAEDIKGALAKNATLLLSGILFEQEPDVRRAYQALGLNHQKTARLNEWVLIEFHKS